MDKIVIGRVVTAIDYPSIASSIKLAVAIVIALLAVPVFPPRKVNAVHINSAIGRG